MVFVSELIISISRHFLMSWWHHGMRLKKNVSRVTLCGNDWKKIQTGECGLNGHIIYQLFVVVWSDLVTLV